MKKNILYTLTFGLVSVFAGCSSEDLHINTEGRGRLVLVPEINAEVSTATVSRGDSEDLLGKLNLVVDSINGEQKFLWNAEAGIPWQDDTHSAIAQTLDAGNYTIVGWAGDSVAASWTERYFRSDTTAFEIKTDEETSVTLTCNIRNTAVEVTYSEGFENVLSDFKLEVRSAEASLEFVERDERTGYFLLPETDKSLEYVLTGTRPNGAAYEYTGKISEANTATKYTLRFNYTDPALTGASAISVEIDEAPIAEETHIVQFRTSPEITGHIIEEGESVKLENDKPYSVTEDKFGDLTLTTKSSGRITSVAITIEGLANTPEGEVMLWGEGRDEEKANALAAAGISGEFIDNTEKKVSSFPIKFASSFTDALKVGNYKFTVKVTDEAYGLSDETEERDANSYEATFNLVITAPGPGAITLEPSAERPDELFEDEILMTGQTTGETDEVGFYIRKAGDETPWEEATYVPATPTSRSIAKNTTFSAVASGLKAGEVSYEYIAAFNHKPASDGAYKTTITGAAPQLPNAGFEDWDTSKTPYLIYADGGQIFWDSGNHGSAKMNKNITTPSSDKKHSGKYSAKLQSQFVGAGAIGKFAAGNIFIGEYLATEGTDGVLGWGRPWTARPRQLKGYVYYENVPVTHSSTDLLKKGEQDQGIIYIALVDGTTQSYNGITYPQIVKTKSSDRQLFDSNASNVLAYGEVVFTESTSGDEMKDFIINLNWKDCSKKPSYIIMVASASRYGDYFTGGNGSVMYLDDLELVY